MDFSAKPSVSERFSMPTDEQEPGINVFCVFLPTDPSLRSGLVTASLLPSSVCYIRCFSKLLKNIPWKINNSMTGRQTVITLSQSSEINAMHSPDDSTRQMVALPRCQHTSHDIACLKTAHPMALPPQEPTSVAIDASTYQFDARSPSNTSSHTTILTISICVILSTSLPDTQEQLHGGFVSVEANLPDKIKSNDFYYICATCAIEGHDCEYRSL